MGKSSIYSILLEYNTFAIEQFPNVVICMGINLIKRTVICHIIFGIPALPQIAMVQEFHDDIYTGQNCYNALDFRVLNLYIRKKQRTRDMFQNLKCLNWTNG